MYWLNRTQWEEYQKYKSLGKTPEELESLISYIEDTAPLPLNLYGGENKDEDRD